MASLYLHIPYCEKKCVYCDFYSIENMQTMELFLQSLETEISLYADRYASAESFETIFLGGGTPSLLPPSVLGHLLDTLRGRFRVENGAEITVETNPGTVDRAKLRSYRELGVNRLSIGIQSFHEEELRFLSRIHTADEARRCVGDAYDAGFDNVSIDLIFALPQQTTARWKENMEEGLRLGPKHISAYGLIVEEHTPLFTMVKEGAVKTASEETDSRMYEETMAFMEGHGYGHYEISNYALPGYECRHNKNYWNHSNYLGFGPSAHSFWKESSSGGYRWWNARSISQYCENLSAGKLPVAGTEG
ncbi:MAG TPA: radical SAM family heme chaperone HemW, partial [Bacteroidota bacterium]|nr:radical SAM family heme chaperone HemW [Bacteroidota bacterium]